MQLDAIIEALLFYSQKPLSFKELASLTDTSINDVTNSVQVLLSKLKDHGITLIIHEDSVTLVTSKETSEYIQKLKHEEVSEQVGKAGMETLSLILYKSPITKLEIDNYRGVNSSTILRNLQIKGLVTKESRDNTVYYIPTTDALMHLGVTTQDELPEFEALRQKLDSLLKE